jgi:hypothetical protein
MAVIQISKMQVRRGQTAQTGIPQLSSGEFGWSIDDQKLFIGNGSVAEGAPAVGNTEIITAKNFNIFALRGQVYTYGGSFGTEDGNPVVVLRSVEAKLDDVVSLNDFGAIGNGVAFETVTIQNAINYASTEKKPLILPEGTFVITGTVYIPSYTELRGAGPGKTIILNQSTTSTFQTIDKEGRLFEDMQNDSSSPNNVRINGITFVSSLNSNQPIMRFDGLSDSIIEQCELVGNIATATSTSTLADAIVLRSIGGQLDIRKQTTNVTIKNCKFDSLAAAIVSDHYISNINILENTFDTLDEGIMLGKTLLPGIDPPKHVRISNNIFSRINYQAIYAGSTSTAFATDINSKNNYFFNVGNLSRGDEPEFQHTEIIRFNSYGNNSEGDTFERLEKMINISTKGDYIISSNLGTTRAKAIVRGPAVITPKSPQVFNFSSGTGRGNPLFGFPLSDFTFGAIPSGQTVTVNYTIVRSADNLVRRGTLKILVIGTSATVTEEYTFTGTEVGPISFTAEVFPARDLSENESTNLLIVYLRTAGASGTIFYTFSVRQ